MSSCSEALESVVQTSVCDVIASKQTEVRVTRDAVFDPAGYFNQWLADVEANRQHLASESSWIMEEPGSQIFVESLPGSNCEVSFEGVLCFDGHWMGSIRSPGGALVVTRRGIVDADIEVGVAVINGTVNGNISASERVYLDRDAQVTGQIKTPQLSVRRGAVFEGDCLFSASTDVSADQRFLKKEEEEELKYFLVGA